LDESFFGDFTTAGAGTVNGLEVEYQDLPSQHWLSSGNLAWLDTRYDAYMDRGIPVARQMKGTTAPEVSGAF
ncbi:hypothetical protein, partial [Stenotrophomonas maltophilia]|uniref:hypothetical protein n=1 Tax=Stenotrophomonas maltophilia TaxID=40324 RepID=UPI00313B0D04